MREGEGGIRDEGIRDIELRATRAHAYIRASRAPQDLGLTHIYALRAHHRTWGSRIYTRCARTTGLAAHAYIRASRAPQDLGLTHIYTLRAHHRTWGSRTYTRFARTTGLGAHAHIHASRAPQNLRLAPEAEDLRPRYCFVRQGEARGGGI